MGSRKGGILNESMKKFGTPIAAGPGSAKEKVGLEGVGTPSRLTGGGGATVVWVVPVWPEEGLVFGLLVGFFDPDEPPEGWGVGFFCPVPGFFVGGLEPPPPGCPVVGGGVLVVVVVGVVVVVVVVVVVLVVGVVVVVVGVVVPCGQDSVTVLTG